MVISACWWWRESTVFRAVWKNRSTETAVPHERLESDAKKRLKKIDNLAEICFKMSKSEYIYNMCVFFLRLGINRVCLVVANDARDQLKMENVCFPVRVRVWETQLR